MPSTIVTTAQSASANSYISVADASTYFDDKLSATAWREASEDDKTRALLQAAARMNDLNWHGTRTTSTQALAWPRADVTVRDSTYWFYPVSGQVFDPEVVPDIVKDAQCELALAYLEGWQDGSGSRITKYAQDGLSVEKEYAQPVGALPAKVLQMINPYIQGAVRVRA